MEEQEDALPGTEGDAAPGQGLLEPQGDVTLLLRQWAAGDLTALDRLTPLIYGELRKLAHRSLRKEARDVTLETTGLVHEAFVRLLKTDVDWRDPPSPMCSPVHSGSSRRTP